jgi:hypothetical protein
MIGRMMGSAAPSEATVPTPPDLRLQFLQALLDIVSLVRDAEPQLSKSLAELDTRERSVADRETKH